MCARARKGALSRQLSDAPRRDYPSYGDAVRSRARGLLAGGTRPLRYSVHLSRVRTDLQAGCKKGRDRKVGGGHPKSCPNVSRR